MNRGTRVEGKPSSRREPSMVGLCLGCFKKLTYVEGKAVHEHDGSPRCSQ